MTTAPPPRVKLIGEKGEPIRALAFAGGGFDTVMQLGVTHALLVARAKPPDVVVGASAGAINAVSLAEVLQAGDLPRQVAKFREIYETYLNAPGTISQAYRPDAFQVDTQKPLEALQLPIHHKREREQREDAVASRAGLINFMNTLLRVNLTFGTLTRAVRRWLGIQAAREIQEPLRRRVVTVGEVFRSLMLVGQNLHRSAPLVLPLLKGAVHWGLKGEPGATAGELIFQSAVWRGLKRSVGYILSLGLLLAVWLVFAWIVLGVLAGIGLVVTWLLNQVWVVATARPPLSRWGLGLAAPFVGMVVISLLAVRIAKPERKGAVLATLWSFIMFVLLLAIWTAVPSAILTIARAGYLVLRDGAPWGWGQLFTSRYWIPAIIASVLVAALVAVVVVAAFVYYRRRSEFGRWFLGQYGLDESILDPYPLNQLLVSLFDRDYYGRMNMARVVETALRSSHEPQEGLRSEKRLDAYAAEDKNPPIHVGVTVADLATGEFTVLPESWLVIDALGAALAAVPVFPAVASDRPWGEDEDAKSKRASIAPGSVSLLVDSLNVANEPTRPLFSFLRHSRLVNPEASALHLYTVAPLPFGGEALGPAPRKPNESTRSGEYTSLVDVALRAWELKRFRDATLERRMTELHTKAMPREGTVFFEVEPEKPGSPKTRIFRSWVYPIEPETPIRANERISQSESPEVTRRIIAETVADGCQAALQVMMRPTVDALATEFPQGLETGAPGRPRHLPCFTAVQQHLGGMSPEIPGASPHYAKLRNRGPGLIEVCSHCALYRHLTREDDGKPRFPRTLLSVDRAGKAPGAPAWPRLIPRGAPAAEPERERSTWTKSGWIEYDRKRPADPDVDEIKRRWGGKWPLARGETLGHERPTVSLLFSGGVFRGVFQLGALNALSEVSLVPDVVAGASVGSITAAMAARAFFTDPSLDPEGQRQARARNILPLSATYLAIDRLVLTDRFADFIRGITVRASEARFSLRDADRALRRFDAARPGAFGRELRRVAAGIERLTYVSPFELQDLLKAFRLQDFGKATHLLRKYFQEWLERVGVGNEILGAEPLAPLIKEYVLKGLPPPGVEPEGVPFQAFSDRGFFFLATATNLTRGCLRIVGEDQLAKHDEATLLATLLASSAFPGVFRPRWHWEFSSTTTDHDQYIDGGVIDNLPLDAVAQFLIRAARADLIPKRPTYRDPITKQPASVPHLLFAASLEPGVGTLDEDEVDGLRHYWPGLMRYAKQLRYNQKLDVFARTQRNLRRIVRTREAAGQRYGKDDWTPLDLEVIAVIPRWLCGTFAFHPMLGFRRAHQAESIAHGCAATLLRLAALRNSDEGKSWIGAWGLDLRRLPTIDPDAADPFDRPRQGVAEGDCWYRPGCLCPFSAEGQKEVGATVCSRTREELIGIYRACGRKETHQIRER